MCGIFCHVSGTRHVELNKYGTEVLARRGPDAIKSCKIVAQASSHLWHLTFTSSVLSLRGNSLQEQPVIHHSTGSIFCWNGEAWMLDDNEVSGNDAHFISNSLFELSSQQDEPDELVLNVLSGISGPYAFVFYDAKSAKLYFGRDCLGRRSLLIRDDCVEQGELTISSLAINGGERNFRELSTPCVYLLDLNRSELSVIPLPPKRKPPHVNQARPSRSLRLEDMPSVEVVMKLMEELRKSLRLRVQDIPTYDMHGEIVNPSRLAVLFSGGLDCTLLARLTHDILPIDHPIDLLNVAFENPRVINASKSDKLQEHPTEKDDPYESCPDRLTGRSSFAELASTCPGREWRFVAVNVPYTDFTLHRDTVIDLMHPHNTEMDLSITSALYFAAKGEGLMSISSLRSDEVSYTTTARVLLSGLGADEIFGGYARHSAAFARGGFEMLNSELELDFARIGTRNLGRDDRVMSHWGRETRYPYLDERFVEFALDLPAWEKCGFRPSKILPKHFEIATAPYEAKDLHPDKMVLRCAMWRLGMRIAAAEKKRAIQFGARTAKMNGGRTKGTDFVATNRTSTGYN